MGFHVYQLKRFISSCFDVYFHLIGSVRSSSMKERKSLNGRKSCLDQIKGKKGFFKNGSRGRRPLSLSDLLLIHLLMLILFGLPLLFPNLHHQLMFLLVRCLSKSNLGPSWPFQLWISLSLVSSILLGEILSCLAWAPRFLGSNRNNNINAKVGSGSKPQSQRFSHLKLCIRCRAWGHRSCRCPSYLFCKAC